MASTLKSSTLTVTVSESVTINGTHQGGSLACQIPNIDEIYKRIIKVPVSEITLYTTDASSPNSSGGHVFNMHQVKYARITVLDTSEKINLRLTNSDSDEFVYVLGGKNNSSFILMDHDNIMEAASATATGSAYGSITSVEASAPNATAPGVDVEIFVAVDGPNTTV